MQIFDSHIEGAQEFPASKRGDIYRAIIEYVCYGTEPDHLKGEAKGFFLAIKPTLDLQRTRSESGRKGGMKTQANREQTAKQTESKQASKTQANDKQADKQTVEQTASEEEMEKEGYKERRTVLTDSKKKETFSKPNATDVYAYAASRGYPNFDPNRFIDYYESNGWKVGRNPMKDWKAAVRTWLSKEEPKAVKADARFEKYR